MKKSLNSLLVFSTSFVVAAIVYLILSGTLIPGFKPLASIVEATSNGSFEYLTNIFPYETSEVSFNMEDMYNSTHLYDFSDKEHSGRIVGSLGFEAGVYGKSLLWESGQILCEDLDIVDSSFTLEAWIYPTSQGNLSLAGVETIYPFIWKASNGSMQYQFSGGPSALYSSQGVELNAWTHIALVYDVSGVAIWYLNGSEQGSKFVGQARDWDGLWSIGQMRPNYASNMWKGRIDEFRMYKNKARTQTEIQNDMKTFIGHKLTLTGLTPNSDVAQLWYPDGEFARTHMLQQTAEANGQVEFNVYSFSGRSQGYIGVLKVQHSGKIYSSSVHEFLWEDVYHFSTHTYFTEPVIAFIASTLIVIVPSALFITYSRTFGKRKNP